MMWLPIRCNEYRTYIPFQPSPKPLPAWPLDNILQGLSEHLGVEHLVKDCQTRHIITLYENIILEKV